MKIIEGLGAFVDKFLIDEIGQLYGTGFNVYICLWSFRCGYEIVRQNCKSNAENIWGWKLHKWLHYYICSSAASIQKRVTFQVDAHCCDFPFIRGICIFNVWKAC